MSNTDQLRISCAFCGASDFKHVFDHTHFVIKCRKCGLVTTEHIPSDETLGNYYHSYPSYTKVSELTLLRYHQLLDKLEPFRKTGHLLEAGCGFGFFLEQARIKNWEVHGTELSATALQECKRRDLDVDESLDYFKSAGTQFDAIVSIEVIEHLSDPVIEVKKYSEILRPGGVLYITTPNFNSLSRRLLKRRWNVIEYPEHIYYFTPGSLNRILTANGFQKVRVETSGFSQARLIYALRERRGDKTINEYDYNEKDRELRDAIEKTVILRIIKKIINSTLTLFKLGDTLKILYKKNE